MECRSCDKTGNSTWRSPCAFYAKLVFKDIVRSFKGKVLKACKRPLVQRALFAIFDVVDDTELIVDCILKVTLAWKGTR